MPWIVIQAALQLNCWEDAETVRFLFYAGNINLEIIY